MPPVRSRNSVQPVSLAGGLDTRDDPRLVQPPQTTRAENIVYPGSNIRRRNGVSLVASPPWATGAAQAVGATNDEVLALDSRANLYGVGGSGALTKRGAISAYQLGIKPLASASVTSSSYGFTTGVYRNVSHAVIGNIGIAIYEDATGEPSYPSVSGTTQTYGTVGITCYDNATKKIYWTTFTKGCVPVPSGSSVYAAYGYTATTGSYTFTTGYSEQGATSPTIVAAGGKFFLSLITTVPGTYTDTGGGGALQSGYWGVLGHYYIACDGVTVPPKPTLGSGVGVNITIQPHATLSNAWYMSFNNDIRALRDTHFYDVITVPSTQTIFVFMMGRLQNVASPYTTPYTGTGAHTLFRTIGTGTFPALTSGGSQTSTYVPSPVALAADVTATYTDRVIVAIMQGVFHITTGTFGTVRSFFTNPSNSPLAVAWNGSTAYVVANNEVQTFPTPSGVVGTQAGDVSIQPEMSLPQNATVVIDSANAQPYSPSSVVSRAFWLQDTSGNNVPVCFLHQPGYSGIDGGLILVNLNAPTAKPLLSAFYLRFHAPSTLLKHATNVSVSNNYQDGTILVPVSTGSAAANNVALQFVSVQFPNVAPNQIVRLPQGALLAGGVTSYYDGQTVRVAGWRDVPPLGASNFSVGSGTGSLSPNTTYSYVAVWVDYDNYGNAIYSSPSLPVSVSTGASGTFIASSIKLPYSASPTACLLLYRNAPSINPLQYYLVLTQVMSPLAGYAGSGDGQTDASIVGNPLLYSPPNGGELPNDPAPASTFLVASKQRVLLASAEVPYQVWASKPFYPGRAPEFTLNNVLDIDPSSGVITGLATLDDNFVIFKKDRVLLLSGPGPDAIGQGAFNPVGNISTDAGCVDGGSILTTTEGVYFRSTRGLNLLTRALQVQYIGLPIEGILDYTSIVASCIVPYNAQLRFACADGTVLCYDYTSKAWSTYKHNIFNGTPATYVNSMALSPDQSTLYATTQTVGTTSGAGYLHTEVVQGTPVYSDNGNAVTWTAQSGTIDVSGPMGFGRVRRANVVGQLTAVPATLNVTFRYDNDATTDQTVSYTFASGPYSAGQSIDIRVRSPRQKCRSVQVTCSASGITDSLIISGLNVELVAASDATRTPDTRST